MSRLDGVRIEERAEVRVRIVGVRVDAAELVGGAGGGCFGAFFGGVRALGEGGRGEAGGCGVWGDWGFWGAWLRVQGLEGVCLCVGGRRPACVGWGTEASGPCLRGREAPMG